jgi:hypothetical protein
LRQQDLPARSERLRQDRAVQQRPRTNSSLTATTRNRKGVEALVDLAR